MTRRCTAGASACCTSRAKTSPFSPRRSPRACTWAGTTCSTALRPSATPGRVYDAHYEAFPLREGVRDDISIFGLTVNANVGFADLTSASSYFGRTGVQTQDASDIHLLLERGRARRSFRFPTRSAIRRTS